jgi:asparagine synthase (glutamine-hydrolysing)
MCGIGGILRGDGKRIPESWLTAIDTRIAHRGPDGAGRFRDRVTTHDATGRRVVEVALVHRRLAIIDLETGDQPLVSKQGRTSEEGLVAVVFNGCIYNHRELRRELEAAGHRFATDHSDTEVLVHGWREWGEGLTDRIEGMYAFGLWDRAAARLFCARDLFGEKPLYVCRAINGNPDVQAFASDARCLTAVGAFRVDAPPQVAPDWVETYLQLGYNHRGRTIYAQRGEPIAMLEPPVARRAEEWCGRAPAPTSVDDVERLLDQAVARRLEADVPLGVFLSGGIDSSLVTCFAKRHLPAVRSFTVRMPEVRYDESEHAQAVADHLGTHHQTLDIAPRPAEDLVHLVQTLGQPFADSSILPTFWVSQAARQHVKVALAGDGGDELFLGYERYRAARILVRWRSLLRFLPGSLLVESDPKARRHRLGRLGEMAREFEGPGLLATEAIFTPEQMASLLGAEPQQVHLAPGADPLQTLRRADLAEYLPNDLLVKVDTASMAVGLEVRAPFLDRDLAAAALAAPVRTLMPGGRRKGLLRSIALRHLPRRVVDRPKMGFAIPVGKWFRTDYGSMRALLLDHLRSRDPFGPIALDRLAVKRLVDEHLAARRDHGQRLFALLTLSIWARGGGTIATPRETGKSSLTPSVP